MTPPKYIQNKFWLNKMKVIKIIIVFIFLYLVVSAQDLPENIQNQINSLKSQAEKFEKNGQNPQAADYYVKAGNLCKQYRVDNQAIEMYQKALDNLKNSQNTGAKINLNTYIAFIYRNKKDYANAEKYFSEAYKYIEATADRQAEASMLYNIAEMQYNQKKIDEAIKNYDASLTIFLELDDWENIKLVAFKLAMAYKEKGDDDNYVKYYNLYTTFDKKIKDEIVRKKEQEALLQKQLARQKDLSLQVQQYKNKLIEDSLTRQQQINQEKTAQIQLQELQLQQKEEALKHQQELAKARQRVITVLTTGLILILIASVVIFFLLIENRKRRKQLEEKNKQIEEQKKLLQKQNDQITASIRYASRIQEAILPMKTQIASAFKDYFIFYRPRDVVSGDFYWYYENKNLKLIAAVDCTGHSVPGAFVSMIANTLLNEIIKAKQLFDLSKILNELNRQVVETLNKNQKGEEINDGMDMSILKFYKNSRKAEFAGANHRSLAIIDGEKRVLEGSIFSIGGYNGILDVKFDTIEIDLGKEACLYMFSDGYADQFNQEGKKFKTATLLKLLEENYNKKFSEQEKILSETFEKWKGENGKQIDDVLVIGLKE